MIINTQGKPNTRPPSAVAGAIKEMIMQTIFVFACGVVFGLFIAAVLNAADDEWEEQE